MPKPVSCLKIPKKQGRKSHSVSQQTGLFDKSLSIQRRRKRPLHSPNSATRGKRVGNAKKPFTRKRIVHSSFFTEKKPPAETLTQALEDKLPPHLLASLPQAFDIIGDIVIVEIPPELKPHENPIGEAILKTHKNIKTVLAKAGAISGTYRTREFTLHRWRKQNPNSPPRIRLPIPC